MAFKRYAKRVAKKVGKVVKKRYFKGKGYSNPKIGQMVKDVAYLKGVLNPEKKTVNISTAVQPLGQINGNSAGYFVMDVTPSMQEGITSSTRNGNSIKLHSTYAQFQFIHQGSTVSPIRVKIGFMYVKGIAVSSYTSFFSTLWNLNPFVLNAGNPAIIDYNSINNPNYLSSFKLFKTKTFTVQGDSLTGQPISKVVKIPLKYNKGKGHHIRYQSDGTNAVAQGQILMFVMADNGNCSTSTTSTLTGLSTPATSTGLNMNYSIQHWFYDN